MVDGHGKEYPIRKHKGKERYYIQTSTGQITVTSLVNEELNDCVYDYIFNGGFKTHKCPAMQYWILRYRMKKNISIEQFKKEYVHVFSNFPPKY